MRGTEFLPVSRQEMEQRGWDGYCTGDDLRAVAGMEIAEIARALFPQLSEQEGLALTMSCMSYENEYLSRHGGGDHVHAQGGEHLRSVAHCAAYGLAYSVANHIGDCVAHRIAHNTVPVLSSDSAPESCGCKKGASVKNACSDMAEMERFELSKSF